MIYLVSFIVGILNGLFAAGAGQILVVYMIYKLKLESHVARALSIATLATASVLTFYGYTKFADFKINIIIVIIVLAFISGIIGAKLFKKIESNFLNLVSGILLTILSLIGIFK